MTPLHAATWGNDTETIRLLVDAGLDVNSAHIAGFTPLINAASTGNLDAAKMLLAKGANVNAVAADPAVKVKAGPIALGNFTPLLMASPFGSAEFVKALLDAGAKVDVREARGLTPLMLAVATDRQNLDVIRMLIAQRRGSEREGSWGRDCARLGAEVQGAARRSSCFAALERWKRCRNRSPCRRLHRPTCGHRWKEA